MATTQIMSTVTVICVLFALSRLLFTSEEGNLNLDIAFRPEGCDYSVVFEAKPRYYTTQKATADGILLPLHGAELAVSGGRGLTRAECVAIDYDVNSLTQNELTYAMQQIALDIGLSRPDFAYEEGQLGKVATITGIKDTERGRVIARITNYYGPGSIMTLYLTSLSADFQTSEMAKFARSIRIY